MKRTLVRLITVSLLVTTLSVMLLGMGVLAEGNALSIGSLTISPTPAVVNQTVTVTIQLDNYHRHNQDIDSIGFTISSSDNSYSDVEELEVSAGGRAVYTFTPPSVGTYNYDIDHVSNAEGEKHGSFQVKKGVSLVAKGSLPTDINGNIMALADGYSSVKLVAAAINTNGAVDTAMTYIITVNDVPVNYVTDKSGRATITIGPFENNALITVKASVAGGSTEYVPKVININFINANIMLYVLNAIPDGDNYHAQPEQPIQVTAFVKDNNGYALPGMPVTFREIMSNGTTLVDSVFTNSTGGYTMDYILGKKAGNNVFTVQLSNLSLIDVIFVRSDICNLANFTLSALPKINITADGTTRHKIVAQITDDFGNNIKDSAGVEVTFTDEYGHTYETQPNSNGVAYAWSDPSMYPGSLNYTVKVVSGDWEMTKHIVVNFVNGIPSQMKIDAYPNIIASSNVVNNNITYAMNISSLVVRVMDQYGNPVAFQPVTLTVVNASQGKIVPGTGFTNASGEFKAAFNLSSFITGSGKVLISGSSGEIAALPVEITYTEDSHLNISTGVDPRRASPGDTINVDVRVDGVGWQAGRAPADVMLVMDRSGSMGDAIGFTNYAAGDNGGWFGPTIYDSSTFPVPNNGSVNISIPHDKKTRLIFKVSQENPTFPGNAVCIDNNIPTEMIAGRTYPVYVVMQNTGDIVWNETNKIRLAGSGGSSEAKAFLNTSTTPYNRVVIAPGVSVARGETYNFTFNLTAPKIFYTNNYTNIYFRMYSDHSDYVNYFGSNSPVKTIKVIPDPLDYVLPNAEIVNNTIPTEMVTGQFYNVSVTFMNTGDLEWNQSTKIRMINYGGDNPYFWITGNSRSIGSTTNMYIPVGTSVKKNETFTFNFTMRGAYTVAPKWFNNTWYRMYKDDYGYFGPYNYTKIHVTPDPAAYPNAEVVSYNISTVMVSGQSYTCNITLRNTGGMRWSYQNGTRLYLRGDNPTFGVGDYIDVPNGVYVQPGATHTFNFTMKAPAVMTNTSYTNAWYSMYMDYSFGPYIGPGNTYGWFGPGYPMFTAPQITVMPVPRAPKTLYGDWYTYKMLSPTNTVVVNTADAGTDYASPNLASGARIIPTSLTVPVINSSGVGQTSNSFAPVGTYTLQITNKHVTAPDVAYRVWVWDNMKMGQIGDQDAMSKVAAKNFIDPNSATRNIWEKDRVGMVTFGTDARIDMPLNLMVGANIDNLKQAISNINSYGDTNTSGALELAVDEITENGNPEASKHIIFLTDGYSTSSDADNDVQVQRIVDDKITVYAIGVADDESKVDSVFLKDLAVRSHGKYFFVKNMTQLLEAYSIIGHLIESKITDVSTISVALEQNATGRDYVDYQTGTAYIKMNNNLSTLKQVEPDMTTPHVLTWTVDPIDLGFNWTLTYKVTASAKGFTHPVGNGTVGHFVFNGTAREIPFTSDAIYINDNNVSTNDMLKLDITKPADGAEIVNSTFDLRWNVTYNATPLTYTQIIEYAPSDEPTLKFVKITSGFEYDQSSNFRYLVDLDKLNIKPGSYTFRIYATDGLFESSDVVDLDILYEHGPLDGFITIKSKS